MPDDPLPVPSPAEPDPLAALPAAASSAAQPPPRPCRHCGRRRACKPRRLCSACYGDGSVRQLYAPGPSARRGVGLGGSAAGQAPLPSQPTAALPGTPEKVAVLIERARRREQLFHPLDAVLPPDLPEPDEDLGDVT